MKKFARNFIMKWLGLGLIVLALLFIPLIAMIPFMPLKVQQKALFITVMAVGGQVLTWIGIFLAGKEIVSRYRKYLNPLNWFKKQG